ncbi:MAG TPA: TfoX/Sxy family protein [Dehalococcoidia bacterium]|nr:TfoX/Sxy family protein [Dehalococcoidia bacterium]
MLEKSLAEYSCERKYMFGSPTFFINNNMFAGVHQRTIILRLSELDRSEILATHTQAKPFEPMPGRVMREYIALSGALCKDEAVLQGWLERAYKYTRSLPPKEPKRRARRKM